MIRTGVDHNMLLIYRAEPYRNPPSSKMGRVAVRHRRVFALSPQSGAIMPSAWSGSTRAGHGPDAAKEEARGLRQRGKPEMDARGPDVTRVLPGFTTNYTIPAKHSSDF